MRWGLASRREAGRGRREVEKIRSNSGPPLAIGLHLKEGVIF
jgi:hypothetical protein